MLRKKCLITIHTPNISWSLRKVTEWMTNFLPHTSQHLCEAINFLTLNVDKKEPFAVRLLGCIECHTLFLFLSQISHLGKIQFLNQITRRGLAHIGFSSVMWFSLNLCTIRIFCERSKAMLKCKREMSHGGQM